MRKITAQPCSCNSQRKIDFVPKNTITDAQKSEAALATYAAVHTSILAVEHVANVCNKVYSEKLFSIRLQRTKCTNIIKNV